MVEKKKTLLVGASLVFASDRQHSLFSQPQEDLVTKHKHRLSCTFEHPMLLFSHNLTSSQVQQTATTSV